MARIVGFGRSGSGKSWLFGWILERAVPQFDYAVHLDMEDEEVGLSAKGRAIFKTFYVDAEFLDEEVEYQGRKVGLVEGVILHNRRVRIVPDSLTSSEKQTLFERICTLAIHMVQEPDVTMWVSADEAHEVLGSNVTEDGDINRVLAGGRKKGLEWAFFTQRPANLAEEAFTQANYGYYLSLTKDVDIAKANGSIGINAYQVLPELQPREFILEDLDSGEIKKHTSNELDRQHEHFAPDDGVADDVAEMAGEGGKDLRELGEDGLGEYTEGEEGGDEDGGELEPEEAEGRE